MKRPDRTQLIIGLTVAAMALAACGTRVDKEAFYASLQGTTTVVSDGGGTAGPPARGSGRASTTRTVGTTTSATTGGASSGSGTRGAAAIPSSVSRTIVGDTITVGMHVPVTGAAPLPLNWIDQLRAIERWLNEEARVHGRGVRFLVEDDGFDPAKGLAACRKLADSDVLFVIGHTMPTVEDRCADLFGKKGIPYLMRGVPESTLDGRPLAWFGTASDDLQAKLLAEYVLARLNGRTRKVGIVSENDQPVSKRVFADVIRDGGGDVVAIENSVPRQPDFGPIIAKLRGAGAEIVFLNIAPVDAIKIAVQSQGDGYHPTWVGEGTHWNYNLTLESAGKAMDGAVVLSNWASIDSPAADGFKRVLEKYDPDAEADDVGLVMWGWTNLVRTALLGAGKDLSAASLVTSLNDLEFREPYWHPIRYTAKDHRGARSIAVFRADGTAKRWRQIEGFSSGF